MEMLDYWYYIFYRHFQRVDKYEGVARFSAAIGITMLYAGSLVILSGFFFGVLISPDELHSFVTAHIVLFKLVFGVFVLALSITVNRYYSKRLKEIKRRYATYDASSFAAGLIGFGCVFYFIGSVVVFGFTHKYLHQWINSL